MAVCQECQKEVTSIEVVRACSNFHCPGINLLDVVVPLPSASAENLSDAPDALDTLGDIGDLF